MKVVLDTNIVISGIFWRGVPHKILKAWTRGQFEVVVSKAILDEYLKVIQRIGKNHKITEKWSIFIAENTLAVKDKNHIKLSRDFHDDKFINAAVLAEVDYLVSGDDDLLTLKDKSPIKIITAHEFLKVLKKIR